MTSLLLCAACHADPPSAPPAPVASSVVIVSGDRQLADPQDLLTEPVRFKVLDAGGTALANVTLQFAIPIGGGSVPVPSVTTDSAGLAEIAWTMGPYGGLQELDALVGGRIMASATATTCDPAECFTPDHAGSSLSDATLLSLATYEASGQTVHPDVVRAHGAATGFWLAITPYPNSNTLYENPSIYRSRDATTWTVPAGAINPLVRGVSPTYLSDPDLVVDTDNTLWLFFRSVSNSENIIQVIRSRDGARWDSATTVVTVPSHELVSPTVVRGAPAAPWQMWSVNAGPSGCSAQRTTVERRVSSDGIHWTAPATVDLAQPGQSIWHLDVEWIAARSEYWALYNTYPVGTVCTTNALYLAHSPDGVRWTAYPSPIARTGIIRAFKHLIYRSTFMTNPKATRVTLWMSGAEYTNNGYDWKTATVTTSVAGLIAIASSPTTRSRTPLPTVKLPPPEPDVGPDH